MFAGVEEFSICFGVKDPFIKKKPDILEGCLLVHVFGEALADLRSVVLPISIAVHELDSWSDPFIVPLCLLRFVFKIRGRQLELRELVVNVVIPLCL